MTQTIPDDLWRDFPKTATEFEARFATEDDCRAYWIEARSGGKPACARCGSERVWTIREGTTFEFHCLWVHGPSSSQAYGRALPQHARQRRVNAPGVPLLQHG
jgi:hypothetical protein